MTPPKPLIALGVLVLVTGALATAYWKRPAAGTSAIRVNGTIEATDAELGFKTAGRLAHRFVDEGDTVRPGQRLGDLDDRITAHDRAARAAEVRAAQAALAELRHGALPAELAQAEAAVARARAQWDEARHGPRPEEIAAARATLQRLRVEKGLQADDAARTTALHAEGATSERDLDARQAAQAAASAQVREALARVTMLEKGTRPETIRQAEAAWKQASAALTLLRQGPRAERITQAEARLAEAKEALAAAEIRQSELRLFAPFAGTVVAATIEPGEFVAPGTPVLTIARLDDVWLRAFIAETELGRVRLGQAVTVHVDGLPDRAFAGTVRFIAPQAEFTPKTVQTQKDRVKLVYRIKVALPNPDHALKPGMPADADIDVP